MSKPMNPSSATSRQQRYAIATARALLTFPMLLLLLLAAAAAAVVVPAAASTLSQLATHETKPDPAGIDSDHGLAAADGEDRFEFGGGGMHPERRYASMSGKRGREAADGADRGGKLRKIRGRSSSSSSSHIRRRGNRQLAGEGIEVEIRQLVGVICGLTLYPEVCKEELAGFNIPATARPSEIVALSAKAAATRAAYAQNLAAGLAAAGGNGGGGSSGVEGQSADDCADLMDYARDRLDAAMARIASIGPDPPEISALPPLLRDVKAWLSQALGYQSACSDGLLAPPPSATVPATATATTTASLQQQQQPSSSTALLESSQDVLAQTIGNVLSLVDILALAGDDLGAWISGHVPPIPPFVHLRRRRRRLLSAHDSPAAAAAAIGASSTSPSSSSSSSLLPSSSSPSSPSSPSLHSSSSPSSSSSSSSPSSSSSNRLRSPAQLRQDASTSGFMLPDWASRSADVRRLLQAAPPPSTSTPPPSAPTPAPSTPTSTPPPPSTPTSTPTPVNAVVAQDGSGDHVNVADAIAAIPSWFQGRYVIYVKAGLYAEVFNVSKHVQNLTLLGDGVDRTVISGDRNVASGLFNTYRTSTVGISGQGFHARDISFRNVAGPAGHQAVALRAAADLLVFYRCSFEGYQDTLYALSGRQLYRECRIYGTVDFVFGNAIAVFQGCELVARMPLPEQSNTVTAQGRKLAADVSGFVLQNCSVHADADLAAAGGAGVNTFLGRPWKAYSRVVILGSELSGVVNPAGWAPWNSSYPFIDTLFYGEFENYGAGSDTSRRVPWPGVHPALSPDQAAQFSFDSFLAASSWVFPNDAGFSS